MTNPLNHHIARRWAQPFTKQKLQSYGRTMAPTVVALAFATAAHAQGTIDMSQASAFMATVKTWCLLAGATCILIGLIFAGIRMTAGRFQEAIPGIAGVLFGAGVIGWGPAWIASLTGQSVN